MPSLFQPRLKVLRVGLIKQNFMEHAKRRNRPGNLEYQAHTYAILVLNTLSYCLQHEQYVSLDDIRNDLMLMLQTARMQ